MDNQTTTATPSAGQKQKLQQEPHHNDEPIPGPDCDKPEYAYNISLDRRLSPMAKFGRFCANTVRVPAHWIRENIVEKYKGEKYYWYHRKYKPALPIDECYIDDPVCIYEATEEYKRLKAVDQATLNILNHRRHACRIWTMSKLRTNAPNEYCDEIEETYEREEINYFIKYGDLARDPNAGMVLNKQKHRMIMERRQKAMEDAKLAAEAVAGPTQD